MNEVLMQDLVEERTFTSFTPPDIAPCNPSPCNARTGKSGVIEKIDYMDLSMVKMKLCLPVEQEGKGWSEEKANRAEMLYKQFLKLIALCPEASIVPNKTIDELWHAHILDTRKYIKDCQDIFGEYLHHFPYFGLRGDDDAQDLKESFAQTCQLFTEHFQEDLEKSVMDCLGNVCSSGGSTPGGTCVNK